MTEATMTSPGGSAEPNRSKERTYYVDLEGVGIKEWDRGTITVPEIRALAGWDDTQPVVEVDLQNNTEETLSNHATVVLQPGHGFAKKVKFKRG